MINRLFDWFSKGEHDSKKTLPEDAIHKFALLYEDLIIGYLEVEDGMWKFYYSEQFKSNSELTYISGFPNLNKIYYSEILWPFFKIRIPGLGQPRIQKMLKEEEISENNEIALLKRFGRKSISNPYVLNPLL